MGQAALGSMSPEQIAKLEAYWGVDTPSLSRYIGWLLDALRGIWRFAALPAAGAHRDRGTAGGISTHSFAWVISGVLGLTLGILAGAFRGRWPTGDPGYCLLISGTPAFWLAILLLLIFLRVARVASGGPVGAGRDGSGGSYVHDRLWHAVLPALTLSITGVANIALHTREKMIGVMSSDYVLFARARGSLSGSSSSGTAFGMCCSRPSPCSLPRSARSSAGLCWWSRCSPTRTWTGGGDGGAWK